MNPSSTRFIVIGAGPAGEAAARVAAKIGSQVHLIEKENLGGLCLNRGCVPSKTLLSYGKKCFQLRNSILNKFVPLPQNCRRELWLEILKEKDRVVSYLKDQLAKTFQLQKIELVSGTAQFDSPNSIEVLSKEKKVIAFDKAVIAVGSRAMIPPPMHEFQKDILDSDHILQVQELPQKWLVVGAGAVGCEYACLLHALGCDVTVIEMKEQIIPGEDLNIANVLRQSFEKRGIQIILNVTVEAIQKKKGLWNVQISNGKTGDFEQVLVCAGRSANVEGLRLENAGIQFNSKGIGVNETLVTSNPNVYAVGDVNGLSLLAHAGSSQGEIAAANALSSDGKKRYDGGLIPRCLYTWPEVASVGMWKSTAEKIGFQLKSQRFFFGANARALAEGESEGFMQILSEKGSGKILGAQMVGPHVTEIIHILAVAISSGLTRENLHDVIYAHPTLSEGIRTAIEK